MEKKKTKVIATRVTQRFGQLIDEFARKQAYINCADLIREALREKIRRDAPELCEQFLDVKTRHE